LKSSQSITTQNQLCSPEAQNYHRPHLNQQSGDIVCELFVLQKFPAPLEVDNILLLVPILYQYQSLSEGSTRNYIADKNVGISISDCIRFEASLSFLSRSFRNESDQMISRTRRIYEIEVAVMHARD
jgi:hypothetical protein